MAAGRHGGFLDNKDKDLRVREADIGVSRKRELYRDRNRDGDREKERDRRDRVDKVRIRTSDAKRVMMNGFSRSSSVSTSSSSGDTGCTRCNKRGHIVGGSVDREPGELSSGSGSDDPGEPQSKVSNGVMDVKMEASTPPVHKRKFSPIVWDRDDVKRSSAAPCKRETESLDGVSLPPPPPLPEGFMPLSSSDTVRLKEGPFSQNSYTFPEFQQDQTSNNMKEPGEVEEDEDYLPARNILASRWADGDDFIEDEESDAKRKSGTRAIIPGASTMSNKKVLAPEFGDGGTRESLDGAETGISGSRAEGESEHEIGRKDHMDIDGVDVDKEFTEDESDTHISDVDIMTVTPGQSQPPQRNINMLQGCRSVDEFERLNKIDEGTYGVVYRAKDKKSGEIVALKKVKMEKETEGFPLTSLREINILLSFHHPSIVDVKEVVVGSSLDSIFMVMEYMEHNLKGLMESMKQRFTQSEVKCLMLQLLEGVKYLHDNWVLHRDLKTSNLLFNNRGELKICDFGLSRQYGSPLKPYTHLVVTLWYRSPELLLGAKEYSTAIDMWSLGCIMAELLAKEPLFNGKTGFDQLDKIFRVLGTPNEKIWPGLTKLPGMKVNLVKHPYNMLREKFPPTSFSGRPTLSEKGFDLLNKLLTYDPNKRISAEDALNHEWFTEVPLPKTKDFMPTFPAVHAQDRRLRRVLKSPDPLEEQRQRELRQGGVATGSLFN